ncbi:hypothetical protein MMC16_000681 [Acarospora aff. strigata]|nr:hypothetical protein [Acarospora aff. strigata]
MFDCSEQSPKCMGNAAHIPKGRTSIAFPKICSPYDQEFSSVVTQRRLPLPIYSDRISSCKWLCGPVDLPTAPLAPFAAPRTRSVTSLDQSNGVRFPALTIETGSTDKSPTQSVDSICSEGNIEPLAVNAGLLSRSGPELASSGTWASVESVSGATDEDPATEKGPKHKLSKQVIHRVVERERRRVCSEIIMAIKTHFLPDLLPEVASNSHKSIVPRNILLEYSLAHIVCLEEKCDSLASDCDELIQRSRREWHASDPNADRHHAKRTTAQSHRDSLREASPKRPSRDTPPASSPSSPNTRNNTADKPPSRPLQFSPDMGQPLSNRRTTWRSDVANKVRKFVDDRKRPYRDVSETAGRKRKRSSSDVSVTGGRY